MPGNVEQTCMPSTLDVAFWIQFSNSVSASSKFTNSNFCKFFEIQQQSLARIPLAIAFDTLQEFGNQILFIRMTFCAGGSLLRQKSLLAYCSIQSSLNW